MKNTYFPPDLSGLRVFMVGIKGTGMAALAELLFKSGAVVTGSDRSEKFYTDRILADLGISYYESFDGKFLPDETDMVIHSSAYSPDENPQLILARERGLPVAEYSEALGALSKRSFSCGISGVHGKTTTTALTGTLLKELDINSTILAGSGVSSFDGSSVHVNGSRYFVAETCEYKRHFLKFSPDILVITNIEEDHLDYFKDLEDIFDAFITYGLSLPENGTLIYCADDMGAVYAAERILEKRKDIRSVAYGENGDGKFRLIDEKSGSGENLFRLSGYNYSFSLKIPGHHLVLDAVAALAVVDCILEKDGTAVDSSIEKMLVSGLGNFRGSKRRSEVIGKWKDILVMDDYGHHPTEIDTTLKGLKGFYPDRRIIVDFMSHTYSRTEALLDEFSNSFYSADIVILHRIYSSAREKRGMVSGRDLFNKVAENRDNVYYFEEVDEALPFCLDLLTPGDLFITMGAGDNWILGQKIAEELKKAEEL